MVGVVRVGLECTARPLPDVARHVQRAARACARRVCADWGSRAYAPLVRVTALQIELVAPGEDARSPIPACCLLPLRLSREPPGPSGQTRQPGGIGHCVVPGDADHWMVRLLT